MRLWVSCVYYNYSCKNTVLWPSIMLTDPKHEHHKQVIGIDGGAGQFVIAPGGRQIKILKVTALKPVFFQQHYAKKFKQ